MTLQTVLSNIIFSGFSFADETIIIASLTALYNGSATARTMLDKVTAQTPLSISFLAGEFQAHGAGGYKLELDLDYQDRHFFITPTGKAIKYPLSVELAHELEHAINGTLDDPKTDINLAGPTVIATNIIHDEIGIAHRLSYLGATDITNSSVQLNKEYTNGATIDTAIVIRTNEGAVNYDVILAKHATTSRDLIIGNDSDNELDSSYGNDFLYGNGGDDVLKGGGDSDFLDGGTGIDTAYYGGFNPITLNIRSSSANSSNPGTIELDRGGSDVDHIKNIEKVMLSSADDTAIVTRNPNIPFPSNVMLDGGAGKDTLQYAGTSVTTSIKEISAVNEADSLDKIKMELIGNIENIIGTAGDDQLNIGLLQNTKVESIDAGAGNDTVWVFDSAVGNKPEIDLGAGNDILKAAPQGSIVYGGSGIDSFELGKDYLVADADTTDIMTYNSIALHGGVTWRGQESPWAKGLCGIKYARNEVGEHIPRLERGSGEIGTAANDNFEPCNEVKVA